MVYFYHRSSQFSHDQSKELWERSFQFSFHSRRTQIVTMNLSLVFLILFVIGNCNGQTHPMAWQREQRVGNALLNNCQLIMKFIITVTIIKPWRFEWCLSEHRSVDVIAWGTDYKHCQEWNEYFEATQFSIGKSYYRTQEWYKWAKKFRRIYSW